MSQNDLACQGESGIYGVDPGKFFGNDANRIAWNGKPIVNQPRATPEFHLQRRPLTWRTLGGTLSGGRRLPWAPRHNNTQETLVPEMCVGSCMKGCAERASSDTEQIGQGSSETEWEKCNSIVTQSRQGDTMISMHVLPSSGYSLQSFLSSQIINMKESPSLPSLGSFLLCSEKPPSKDSNCLECLTTGSSFDDSSDSQSYQSYQSSSPYAQSSRCMSCDSCPRLSWSWDASDCFGSCSDSSFSSLAQSKTGATMFKSYTESSPSSASCHDSSPFSPSSSGVSATDSDFSGTCDCTGSVKAHQVCGILGGGRKSLSMAMAMRVLLLHTQSFSGQHEANGRARLAVARRAHRT